MSNIQNVFGRNDFDADWSASIEETIRQCQTTFGEPVAGYTQLLSFSSEQPMSIWFVVGDQLVRMQHGQPGGTTWPIALLHGSMSHSGDARTLTVSQNRGEMAFAIIALDRSNAAQLERFLRVLVDRGLDVT